MSAELAGTIVGALGAYAAVGIVFALVFAWRGAARIDPAAVGSTRGFRLIILPGSAALWPLLLLRWLRGAGRPEEPGAHRRAAADAP